MRDNSKYDMHLPRPTNLFAGRDLHEVEIESHTRAVAERKTTGPTILNPLPPIPPLPAPAPDAYSLTVNIDSGTEVPRNGETPESPTDMVLAEDIGFEPVILSEVDIHVPEGGVGHTSNEQGQWEAAESGTKVLNGAEEVKIVSSFPDALCLVLSDKLIGGCVQPPAPEEARRVSLASMTNASFVTAHGDSPISPAEYSRESRRPQSPPHSRPSSRQSSHHGFQHGGPPMFPNGTNIMEPPATPVGEVHYGISCDGCGSNPIIGVRYKCLE